jgi:hypothetical protein
LQPIGFLFNKHPAEKQHPAPKARRQRNLYELKIDKMKEIVIWIAQFREDGGGKGSQQPDQVLYTLKNKRK